MSVHNKHFLAVSANKEFLAALSEAAGREEYTFLNTNSSGQAFKNILTAPPAIIFLDSGLKDMNASSWLTILRSMKEGRNLPVVVIGDRHTPEETASFFELGADDCIPLRHCDPRELAARLRAVLRRRYGQATADQLPLHEGPVTLDLNTHRCLIAGVEVALRPREFELLELLMKKSGRVLNRPYLLESVWGMSSTADTRAVDVTVSRLRKALGPKAGKWLESVAKFGYRFAPPENICR
ncbi:MAG TPA: response regulator transcription factor [Elusimicrobiales bacterium]|nr:response regulator transcription factor [Elusimicrobiales bacterium]